MTELDIQESLFDRFKALNEFSGVPFLAADDDGNYLNVSFPNVPFEAPSDKRWFELTFRSNEPEAAALMHDAQERFTGVLYIDIITPTDAGEDEAREKFRWIARLFRRGTYFDDVCINKCYVSTKGAEADHYRLQAAVEWDADIDIE